MGRRIRIDDLAQPVLSGLRDQITGLRKLTGRSRAGPRSRVDTASMSERDARDLHPAGSGLPSPAGGATQRLSRRRALGLAGAGVAAMTAQPLFRLAGAGAAQLTGSGASATTEAACMLTPELTEGPYYLDHARVRRNITEGRPGRPLRLLLRVVDATGCDPIENAAVDIWHTDAQGRYSHFNAANDTFLRGVQRTGPNGWVTFQSLYPGWYPGRATHIHVKVHIGGDTVHTGQLFFPEAVTTAVYRGAAYQKPGARTRNAQDGIYQQGGASTILALTPVGSGYKGTLTMGVQT